MDVLGGVAVGHGGGERGLRLIAVAHVQFGLLVLLDFAQDCLLSFVHDVLEH